MAFFEQAITVLQTLVIALGAGLGIWGVINLLEGYGNAFFIIFSRDCPLCTPMAHRGQVRRIDKITPFKSEQC